MNTLASLALVSFLSTAQVEGQPPKVDPNKLICGTYTEMIKYLETEHGEIPFIDMLTVKFNSNLQFLANPTSGTWTVIAVNKIDNKACLIDFGVGLKPAGQIKQ